MGCMMPLSLGAYITMIASGRDWRPQEQRGPIMAGKARKEFSWFRLYRSEAKLHKGHGIKKPLKREPCLYDAGNDLRLTINGYIVLFAKCLTPGDRINFFRDADRLFNSYLLD